MDKIVELLKTKDVLIPRILLFNYTKLKLNTTELVIIIILLNSSIYNPKQIAECMEIKLPLLLEMIASLEEKGILKIELNKVNNIQVEEVNLTGLYEKLSFLITDSKKNHNSIYETFEQELGRTLSPIEYELVGEWLNTNSEELLLLALKEATYNGVSNFRYIDRIIHEWNKKGIKTREDVAKNNIEFKKNKIQKQELFDYDWLNDTENN